MSRVARSARVGSRQRVEAITASKDLQSAETGELYWVDQDGGAIVITLPTRQDGAYFKFLAADELTGLNTKTIIIRCSVSADTNGNLIGTSTTIKDNGAVTIDGDAKASINDGHHIFTINASSTGDKLYAGSEVEVYCDGTNWILNARLMTDESTTLGKFSG